MKSFFSILLAIYLLCPPAVAVPTQGHRMMVATPTQLSADIAQKIILKGGNVVDVAVAIGLTLAVTNPRHAALGGGGFALIKMGKKPVEALDFREVAPKKTNPEFFKNKNEKASLDGANAIGVPGFPAGLWAMHKKYGKLHWSLLFDEPIKLADKGFRVSGEWVERTDSVKDKFNTAGKKYFLNRRGLSYKPGQLLKQKQLAKALKEMRNRGITPFYRGQIGQDIVKTVQSLGGVLSEDDLRHYKVRWLQPITTEFKGKTVYLMPPPSSGGLIIAASLKMIEELKVDQQKPLSIAELHYLAEIMKINFRNRTLLADPDFHKNPTQIFLDQEEIKKSVKLISDDKVLKLDPVKVVSYKESPQTTHFTVLDAKGNAVALTVTLNTVFGSKVVSDKYGIALNNEMDDFTTRPGEPNFFGLVQGPANKVEPGKRPLSSMSPTLVSDKKDGKIVMALGAPGGSRIITGVLQTLYRVLAQDYNMDDAIQAPRIHHQFLPRTLFVDEHRFAPETIEGLKKLGHEVEESWHSKVNGVRVNKKGFLEAAFDSRAEGGANGI